MNRFLKLRRRILMGRWLSRTQRTRFRALTELLVPLRVSGSGFTRQPLHLRIHRRGIVWLSSRRIPIDVEELSVFDVRARCSAALRPGTHARVSIEGATEGIWYDFEGTVRSMKGCHLRIGLGSPSSTLMPGETSPL